jgi:hypothetical protein
MRFSRYVYELDYLAAIILQAFKSNCSDVFKLAAACSRLKQLLTALRARASSRQAGQMAQIYRHLDESILALNQHGFATGVRRVLAVMPMLRALTEELRRQLPPHLQASARCDRQAHLPSKNAVTPVQPFGLPSPI